MTNDSDRGQKKTRLRRISFLDTAVFVGFCSFILSIFSVLSVLSYQFGFIGHGIKPSETITVSLNGFFCTTQTGVGAVPHFQILEILMFLFINPICGLIFGFIIAWFYNFYARAWGGISIEIDQNQK